MEIWFDIVSIEAHPSIDRVYYECWLYGADVYYGFAQYCFWMTVKRNNNQEWLCQYNGAFGDLNRWNF